jgi:hypothetical protein
MRTPETELAGEESVVVKDLGVEEAELRWPLTPRQAQSAREVGVRREARVKGRRTGVLALDTNELPGHGSEAWEIVGAGAGLSPRHDQHAVGGFAGVVAVDQGSVGQALKQGLRLLWLRIPAASDGARDGTDGHDRSETSHNPSPHARSA